MKGTPQAADVITVRVPMALRKYGGTKRIVAPDGGEISLQPKQPDSTLVKALSRAFRWRKLLESGKFSTIAELAASEKINPSYMSRVLRLTLLAPDIVEAILSASLDRTVTIGPAYETAANRLAGATAIARTFLISAVVQNDWGQDVHACRYVLRYFASPLNNWRASVNRIKKI